MSCRAVSSARSRDRTCIYGRHNNRVAHLYYLPGVYIYICIYKYISDLCVPIYWRTYTHAQNVTGRIVGTRNRTHVYMEAMHPHAHTHKMSPAASSARAIAHTWTWRRCIHMRTRSLSITEVYSYLLRVPPVICTKTKIYKYTHVALYT
jgi:hypothetical protein